MSIVILFLHPNNKNDRFSSLTNHVKIAPYYEKVAVYSKKKLTIIRRSDVNYEFRTNNTTIVLRRDNFPPLLSWWQEPEDLFRYITTFNPELIHIMGLDLPLHFRWLRKQVGDFPYILGQYTGEQIWPNIKIWMQQFGLRTADGFLFEDKQVADIWLKRAAILCRQDIFKIKNLHRNPEYLAQVYALILEKK